MACVNPDVEDFCPTQEELAPQLLALLPRGRAWGEGGPGREPGGIIYAVFWGFAGVIAALHQAICALALEFVCQTATLTLDQWMAEYGLPDGCDPYGDLCAKVKALGGVTCAYYREIAAALGWTIACSEVEACSTGLGTCFSLGLTSLGASVASPVRSTLVVAVDLANSPAYAGGAQGHGIVMGCYRMGGLNTCGPDLNALDCVLERIVGAHVAINYVTI